MMHSLKQLLFRNTSEKQIVFKNTFWLTISEMFVRLLRFGLILYAARILGAEGWGLFSYTLSFVGLIMTFSDLGLSTLITREFSAQRKDWIKSILILKGVLIIISMIASIIIGLTTQPNTVTPLIILVTILLVSDSLRSTLSAFMRAKEKMEHEALIQSIANISIVIFSVIFISLNPVTYSLALGYLVGSCVGLLLSLYITGTTLYRELISPTPITIRPVLNNAWPIAILVLSSGIITNIDSVMIGWWLSITDVGYYATAGRIVQFGLIIPSLFVSALFPTLTKIYQENKERFIAITQTAFSSLIILAIPLVVGGMIIAEPLIIVLFGIEYTPATSAFRVLLLGTLVLFPTILYNILAIITDKQIIIAKNTCIAIIVSVVLNLILIPKFGITGAAIGTIITHTVIFIANIIFIGIPVHIHTRTILWVTMGTVCMSIVTFLTMLITENPLVSIIVASGSYGVFLLVVKEPVVQSLVHIFLNKKTP